jgi:hypothetical protein
MSWASASAARLVLDLAILGMVGERARSTSALIAAARRVGGGRFQPTGDVIEGRIAALVETGLLVAGVPSGEPLWQLSAAGRAQIQRLLMSRAGAPGDALAEVCAGLKICFLGLLDPEARGAVLDDLLAAHRRALREAEAARAGCPCRCPFVQRYLARDVERWQAELSWLEALQLTASASASW